MIYFLFFIGLLSEARRCRSCPSGEVWGGKINTGGTTRFAQMTAGNAENWGMC